jgi:hypothetical protein
MIVRRLTLGADDAYPQLGQKLLLLTISDQTFRRAFLQGCSLNLAGIFVGLIPDAKSPQHRPVSQFKVRQAVEVGCLTVVAEHNILGCRLEEPFQWRNNVALLTMPAMYEKSTTLQGSKPPVTTSSSYECCATIHFDASIP